VVTPKPTEFEWPTLLMMVATYGLWACGTMLWTYSPLMALVVTSLTIAQFSSLQHEVLHGHPFPNQTLNEALVFPALTLVMPYERFRDLHLQHHHDPDLTDPYDDPESNFQDPLVWAGLSPVRQGLHRFNNTLAGRMLVGPLISCWALICDDVRLLRRGAPGIVRAWVLNAVGVALVFAWLLVVGSMPVWAYLIAAYLGYSLLKIRTFLEHRAHEAFRARTVVVEDRGPLSLLFLNNNFHVVHHMHPTTPWYRLPALYAARRDHFLRRNDAYVYRSYAQIFRQYFFHAKDPVPHPLMSASGPVKQRDMSSDQTAERRFGS
jgi:fatty acid desaturase